MWAWLPHVICWRSALEALRIKAINLILSVVVLWGEITCCVIEQFSKGSWKLNLDILTTNVLFYLLAVHSHSFLIFKDVFLGVFGCSYFP